MNILTLRGIGLFLVAFLNLLLFLLLWTRRRKNKEAFYVSHLAIFSAIYAFVCGGLYFFWDSHSISSVFWYRSTWLGAFLMPAYLKFVYYLTKDARYLKIKSFFLYLGAAAISFTSLTTPYFLKSAYLKYPHIVGVTGVLDPVGRLYIFFCVVIGIFYLLKEYFRSQSFRRLQLRYFIIGIIVWAMAGIVTTVIIPLFKKEGAHYDIAAYFSFIWVALTSYAVLKYRLFDIRLVLGRLAVYLLSTTTFIGAALLVLFLNVQLGFLIPIEVIFILVLLLVIFTYSPLFHFFERIAGKYFYYTYYNLQLTLQRLSKQFNRTIELDKLTTLINRSLLDALKLDKAGIILKESKTNTFQPQQLIKLKTEEITSLLALEDNFLQKYLQKEKRPLVREEIPFLIKELKRKKPQAKPSREEEKIRKKITNLSALKEKADKLEIGLFLPLLVKEELIGIIILGNKLSGEAYTVQDLDLLTALSVQASIAFNNALSYQEIQKRKEELEKFYKLTVGRELKMIELKKKIKELEGKMGKK